MYILTEQGKIHVEHFIAKCKAIRKDILDANKDTADNTTIPTIEDILCDIKYWYVGGDECYYNNWGITDHYDYDIALKYGKDFILKN